MSKPLKWFSCAERYEKPRVLMKHEKNFFPLSPEHHLPHLVAERETESGSEYRVFLKL